MAALTPPYLGPMEPVYPCRLMTTRHCPAAYAAPCGDRPCARYESNDETPWVPELGPQACSVGYAHAGPCTIDGKCVHGGHCHICHRTHAVG